MENQVNRRRFYRVFLVPKFQLKYGAYYAVIALACIFSWNTLAIAFLGGVLEARFEVRSLADISRVAIDVITGNPLLIGGGVLSLLLFFLSVAVVFTHRIVGPVKAMHRQIEALKAGKYGEHLQLRKGDELEPLVIALNELSDVLAERHGRPR